MMETILITGANRGIGLALVRRFSFAGFRVIATARQPQNATALQELIPADDILELDVARDESIRELGKILEKRQIQLAGLVNNAGVYGGREGFDETDSRVLMDTFRVNAVGPLMVLKACLPVLLPGAKLLNVSSGMGSITRTSGRHYAYRMSKAALNMTTRNLSVDFSPDRLVCVSVHPGWVQTDMGGARANLTPSESADALYTIYSKLRSGDSGRYFNYTGVPLDW